ncbi:MAG: metabolite traffic protein EboE [Verrucomicrobiales bacterium]|nr:metabolite traffic protein EboE [Verrucomicrobiales bacterium]
MKLQHGIHLGYCTNIHRGESWEETFAGLSQHTDRVRQRVCPDDPYAIGLRLGYDAIYELNSDPARKKEFAKWLDETNSYLFTINGFPYGRFHGGRVKEQVYAPDWTTTERLDYTNALFDFVVEMAPPGDEVSVSTLPGSFKEFIKPETAEEQIDAIVKNLRACSRHIGKLRDRTGRDIHLGLEPEPLGLFENTAESIAFFERLVDKVPSAERESILQNIGINYDTCHFAVEFEDAASSLPTLVSNGLRISKIHLSSALALPPTDENVQRLGTFDDEVYLHQTIVQSGGEVSKRFRDIPDVMEWYPNHREEAGDEWRVHFHIPLHAGPDGDFGDTTSQISGVLEEVAKDPDLCRHFEMETYTWEVMPASMQSSDVVDQLAAEYDWCLAEFSKAGLR